MMTQVSLVAFDRDVKVHMPIPFMIIYILWYMFVTSFSDADTGNPLQVVKLEGEFVTSVHHIVCDYNNDTHQDIVVWSRQGAGEYAEAVLYEGNNNFTFTRQHEHAINESSNFLLCDDFDNDGYNDLVYRNGVLLGIGDGLFSPQRSINLDITSYDPVVADVDGDGFQDIIAASNYNGEIPVYINNNDDTFAAPLSIAVEDTSYTNPVSHHVTPISGYDFNNDGYLDLLCGSTVLIDEYTTHAGSKTAGPEKVLCLGILFGPINENIPDDRLHIITRTGNKGQACDLNGDSHLDILVQDYEVYLNNGFGEFHKSWSRDESNFSSDGLYIPPLVDTNDDEKTDILYLGINSYTVMAGNGDGTFSDEISYDYDGYEVIEASVIDINNDKREDIFFWSTEGTYIASFASQVEVNNNVPIDAIECRNFPNPFNQSTMIHFTIPDDGNVSLSIYNAVGQRVRTLFNGYLPAGEHNAPFDSFGLSTGTYIYRCESQGYVKMGKMLLIK